MSQTNTNASAVMEEDTYEDQNIIDSHYNENLNKVHSTKPLFSFGIITDIQYADHDNATNYVGDKIRYYRNSINLVKEAVNHWQTQLNETNLKFIIQLGDIIDAKAAKTNRDDSLKYVLNELKSDFATKINDFKLLHIWGNHEMYCFKRNEILSTELNSAVLYNKENPSTGNYYMIDLTPQIKLICLDFYVFSALGYDESSNEYKEAIELLLKHNHNQDLNSADGLRGHAKRFTKFNGMLNKDQFKWLDEKLAYLKQNNFKVIVCGHLPVHPQATESPMCLSWDFKEVLDLFGKYEKTILAYFSGHDHEGGYFRDKHNIHHLTFAGIIETPPNSNSFATVKIYDNNKISIEGVGLISNYEIYY